MVCNWTVVNNDLCSAKCVRWMELIFCLYPKTVPQLEHDNRQLEWPSLLLWLLLLSVVVVVFFIMIINFFLPHQKLIGHCVQRPEIVGNIDREHPWWQAILLYKTILNNYILSSDHIQICLKFAGKRPQAGQRCRKNRSNHWTHWIALASVNANVRRTTELGDKMGFHHLLIYSSKTKHKIIYYHSYECAFLPQQRPPIEM